MYIMFKHPIVCISKQVVKLRSVDREILSIKGYELLEFNYIHVLNSLEGNDFYVSLYISILASDGKYMESYIPLRAFDIIETGRIYKINHNMIFDYYLPVFHREFTVNICLVETDNFGIITNRQISDFVLLCTNMVFRKESIPRILAETRMITFKSIRNLREFLCTGSNDGYTKYGVSPTIDSLNGILVLSDISTDICVKNGDGACIEYNNGSSSADATGNVPIMYGYNHGTYVYMDVTPGIDITNRPMNFMVLTDQVLVKSNRPVRYINLVYNILMSMNDMPHTDVVLPKQKLNTDMNTSGM